MGNQVLALKKRVVAAIVLIASCGAALAQMSPVGRWHSIDDKTGELKSLVVINDANGVLNGHIEAMLRKDADQKKLCTECTDDRKGKPVLGMEIIRGAKKAEGKDVWEGGQILDPENGKEYHLRLTPIDGGQKLEVRGYIGMPLLGRTQTWVRVP
jgi:uncharacterized protein (DUF2147 family)